MSQKTFYTNLSNLKLPEIKTISTSTEIYNKGLIRKEKKNRIRLVDNNSIISHMFVRRKKLVRGNSLKIFKARLQHRRDDFYTGNFLIATSKIRFKNAPTDFLQKLQNMRQTEKVVSVPHTEFSRLQLVKKNKAIARIKSQIIKYKPELNKPELKPKVIKVARSFVSKVFKDKEKGKIKSLFVSPVSKKTKRLNLQKIKVLSLKLKKEVFQGKILPKKKQIDSKKNNLRKLKRFSRKFPVTVAGRRL